MCEEQITISKEEADALWEWYSTISKEEYEQET